ncbi:MAG: DNA repair protein RecO [Planctomycetia bacterium]|nr:DNA repair protein RecO [Planctomycetia bacterium]
MASYEKDEAICLRVIDFSESSQILTLLCRNIGVMALLAKGSRKISKGGTFSLGSPIDQLARGEVVFIPPRATSDLATLTAWTLLDHQPILRKSLSAFYAGQIISEIVMTLLSPQESHRQLYDELEAGLEALGGTQNQRIFLSIVKYILTATGFQPHLESCLMCKTPIRPGVAAQFCPRSGGACCGRCPTPSKSVRVDGGVLLALARLPAPSALLPDSVGKPAPAAALRAAATVLRAALESAAERPLKTRWALDALFGTSNA